MRWMFTMEDSSYSGCTIHWWGTFRREDLRMRWQGAKVEGRGWDQTRCDGWSCEWRLQSALNTWGCRRHPSANTGLVQGQPREPGVWLALRMEILLWRLSVEIIYQNELVQHQPPQKVETTIHALWKERVSNMGRWFSFCCEVRSSTCTSNPSSVFSSATQTTTHGDWEGLSRVQLVLPNCRCIPPA